MNPHKLSRLRTLQTIESNAHLTYDLSTTIYTKQRATSWRVFSLVLAISQQSVYVFTLFISDTLVFDIPSRSLSRPLAESSAGEGGTFSHRIPPRPNGVHRQTLIAHTTGVCVSGAAPSICLLSRRCAQLSLYLRVEMLTSTSSMLGRLSETLLSKVVGSLTAHPMQ
ncbi:hypothetical protein Tco_0746879 [Tanacetum coccineum]